MENMVIKDKFKNQKIFWNNKNVLITGHSGFKGSWLTLWLNMLGAKVTGISLKPNTNPNIFDLCNIRNICNSNFINISNLKKIKEVINFVNPEIVFHLAAQPLVIESYKNPLKTLKTNFMGTANILAALNKIKSVKVIIIVTTDKVYEYPKSNKALKETDRLGGNDIYSASKASCELLVNAYRSSFFNDKDVLISTVRSGNIIGGGDWSKNRIFPDIIRCIYKKKSLKIRNPMATRPWQHVIEPVYGYLKLAELMFKKKINKNSFNFGPGYKEIISVEEMVKIIKKIYPSLNYKVIKNYAGPLESKFLTLDIENAKKYLNYNPQFSIYQTVRKTLDWYLKFYDGYEPHKLCENDIKSYLEI